MQDTNYVIRYSRQHESHILADSLASSLSSKNYCSFCKNISRSIAPESTYPSKVGSAEGPKDICNHWLMHYKTLFSSVGYDSNIMEDIISGAATPTTGDFMFVRGS